MGILIQPEETWRSFTAVFKSNLVLLLNYRASFCTDEMDLNMVFKLPEKELQMFNQGSKTPLRNLHLSQDLRKLHWNKNVAQKHNIRVKPVKSKRMDNGQTRGGGNDSF